MKRKLTLRRETLRELSSIQVRRAVGGLPIEGNTNENCGTNTCACGTGPESDCYCLVSGGGKTCPHYGGGGSG